MGLDIHVYMVRNRAQLKDENFVNNLPTGWIKNEDGTIDFSQPTEVYYARKFWDLYSSMKEYLHLDDGEFSQPLSYSAIESMIDITTHTPDYFGTFNTVSQLCEILHYYYDIKDAGMVLIFEGDD